MNFNDCTNYELEMFEETYDNLIGTFDLMLDNKPTPGDVILETMEIISIEWADEDEDWGKVIFRYNFD